MSGEVLYCRLPINWFSDPSLCWFEWQTIISGLLAVAAAFATVRYLKKQIAQSENHERERLRRLHDSARATLPLTLSGLAEIIQQMLRALEQAKAELKRPASIANFDGPMPPENAISELQQIILSTDNADIVRPISEIIRQMQTLWARVRILRDERQQATRAGLSLEVNNWIIQSAQIHALIESLFDYARCEKDVGPTAVGWDRAESVLVQMYIYDAELREIVGRGLQKSNNFWPRS